MRYLKTRQTCQSSHQVHTKDVKTLLKSHQLVKNIYNAYKIKPSMVEEITRNVRSPKSQSTIQIVLCCWCCLMKLKRTIIIPQPYNKLSVFPGMIPYQNLLLFSLKTNLNLYQTHYWILTSLAYHFVDSSQI